jgi:hypothetical protein
MTERMQLASDCEQNPLTGKALQSQTHRCQLYGNVTNFTILADAIFSYDIPTEFYHRIYSPLIVDHVKKIEIQGEVVLLLRWLLLCDYHLLDLPVLPFSGEER